MFDPSDYAGRVDCIAAGFPCQDISAAGNQAGVGEGTRSGLYREVLRIADIVRPRYLFLENVAAILANEHLGTVLGDLAARGFDARWCCLEASGVGAPHKRDRWWMLANLANVSGGRLSEPCEREMEQPGRTEVVGSGLDSHSNRERQLQPQGLEQDERGRIGDVCANVADAWSDGGFRGREREICGDGNRRGEEEIRGISIIEAAGCGQNGYREGPTKPDLGLLADELAPHVDWWSEEPDVGRVAEGIPNRGARLKMLGNGQVPLQAATAWMMLGGPL